MGLAPFPGRFQLAWQVALVCALAAAVSMTYRVPEAAISLYLVIFLMKRDALNNCVMAFGLVLLATVVVAGMVPLITLSAETPALRLVIIFGASFVFLYLSSATMLGEQAAIIGLIIAFILTLVGDVPTGEIADQGLLMAWKMVAVPMVTMFVFSLIAGPAPQRLVREKIVDRLRQAANRLDGRENSEAFRKLLEEGNQGLLQQMMLARLLRLARKSENLWLMGATVTSYRILLCTADRVNGGSGTSGPDDARALNMAADRIEGGETPLASDVGRIGAIGNEPLTDLLGSLCTTDGGSQAKFSPPAMVFDDALTNPDHFRFALKTASAAVLCYLFYTGIQWDGIHTAMITCYVASLGSVGETVHKLLLRIGGCLVGALLGVASLLLVMPHITSIGGLMALVFAGVLAGAWVSSGDEQINYAGVQIALAFLLTVLNDFGPSFEFSQASDRIIGILVGNLVVFLVFTQFWPKSALDVARQKVASAASLLQQAAETESRTARVETVAAANSVLAEAGRLMDAISFEPARLHPDGTATVHLREAIRQLWSLSIALGAGGISPDRARSSLAAIRENPGLLPITANAPGQDAVVTYRGGA